MESICIGSRTQNTILIYSNEDKENDVKYSIDLLLNGTYKHQKCKTKEDLINYLKPFLSSRQIIEIIDKHNY